MPKPTITNVTARQILDSRGNPTIEVDIILDDDSRGRAAVPSGVSTGEHEAVELRDRDIAHFLGKGVLQAVKNVQEILGPAIYGMVAQDQRSIDQRMIALDGTENKSQLGANAILGISMANARAVAASRKQPLFQSLGGNDAVTLPIPMINILNGGCHADNNVDIQEFMVFPIGAESFSHALQMGTEIFHHLKSVLKYNGLNTAVGDEGGFAPNLRSNEEALEVITAAVDKTNYTMGKEIFLALDVAASELLTDGHYHLDDQHLSSKEMINYYNELVDKYPIVSIEDGLAEDDWDGWQELNAQLGNRIQIVGDDLTVTNMRRLQRAVDEKSINAILIKLNQIGTVTETIAAVNLARKNNLGIIVSHRSGETEDTTIADFAVAMGTGQIKTGSASRTDRICKYNQLLRIEEILDSKGIYPGMEALGHS